MSLILLVARNSKHYLGSVNVKSAVVVKIQPRLICGPARFRIVQSSLPREGLCRSHYSRTAAACHSECTEYHDAEGRYEDTRRHHTMARGKGETNKEGATLAELHND